MNPLHIDVKKYMGRLRRRDKGGWRTIVCHVYVNGCDQTNPTGGLHMRAAVVRTVLDELEVPIQSALCFSDVKWDLFLKPF